MQKDITVEKQTRLVVAKSLLATGCVQVRTEEPFRLPSGWASPIYMDCRILISFPEMMRQFVQTQRESREYEAFLQRKVDIARTSMHSGNGLTNEEVEAEFAARRGKAATEQRG